MHITRSVSATAATNAKTLAQVTSVAPTYHQLAIFAAEFWDHFEDNDTPHSWAMRGLSLTKVRYPRLGSKHTYDYLTGYACRRQDLDKKAAKAAKAVKVNHPISSNKIMWSAYTTWYEAFEREGLDCYAPETYADDHWSRFVNKKYGISIPEIKDWLYLQTCSINKKGGISRSMIKEWLRQSRPV